MEFSKKRSHLFLIGTSPISFYKTAPWLNQAHPVVKLQTGHHNWERTRWGNTSPRLHRIRIAFRKFKLQRRNCMFILLHELDQIFCGIWLVPAKCISYCGVILRMNSRRCCGSAKIKSIQLGRWHNNRKKRRTLLFTVFWDTPAGLQITSSLAHSRLTIR